MKCSARDYNIKYHQVIVLRGRVWWYKPFLAGLLGLARLQVQVIAVRGRKCVYSTPGTVLLMRLQHGSTVVVLRVHPIGENNSKDLQQLVNASNTNV